MKQKAGPLIVVGAGGVQVELYKDVAIRHCAMLDSLPLLRIKGVEVTGGRLHWMIVLV